MCVWTINGRHWALSDQSQGFHWIFEIFTAIQKLIFHQKDFI